MRKSFILTKRRAISETIGTLMILVVTVAGAVLLSNLLSDNFFPVDQTPTVDVRVDSLRLSSYDARDSDALTDIPNLDNEFNQLLCTASCNANPNNLPSKILNPIPADQGTEFIVLQVRNMNTVSVFLSTVSIKNVGHSWDANTVNKDLDLTANSIAGTYPLAGKFSIIPVSNDPPITQLGTNEILAGGEVRLLIKLSEQIQPDIDMWSSLRILVNFGSNQPAEFIILSGDAKW